LKIWPLLKPIINNRLYQDIVEKENNKFKKETRIYKLIDKFIKIKPAIFNVNKLLKKDYKYILFTDTLEKRLFKEKYIDKIAQGIIDYFGQDNLLIIENPVNNFHYPINKCQSKNIVSLRFFQILAYVLYKLVKLNGIIGAGQSYTLVFFVFFILTWIVSYKSYRMPWLLWRMS